MIPNPEQRKTSTTKGTMLGTQSEETARGRAAALEGIRPPTAGGISKAGWDEFNRELELLGNQHALVSSTASRGMVRKRAVELAADQGRSAAETSKSDWDNANRELTGETAGGSALSGNIAKAMSITILL